MATATEAKVADVKKLVSEAAATAAPQARKTIEEGAAQTRVTVEKTMDQTTKATEGLFKAAEEAAEFSRGNLEAVAKATQVYVAGVQDLGKQTLAMVQGLADHTVAGAKALGTVKSLKEAAEVQSTYARAALEKSFSETAKLQEAALKLAEASFAPISARMTLAVEKFSRPVAA
jgi:phasin family protein